MWQSKPGFNLETQHVNKRLYAASVNFPQHFFIECSNLERVHINWEGDKFTD